MTIPVFAAELVALVGGTVHSMVPGEAPRVATILVEDGRVVAVGSELELPPGAERYDVSGRHVVPGLIDALVYFDPEHDALYTAAGVTAVRDVGGARVRALLAREPALRDRVPGPTLTTCGAVLDGDPPSSPDAAVLRNAHGADTLLPILFEEGVDFLCVQLGLGEEAWERVIELAHEEGLEVWGPLPSGVSLERALEAGQDGLHHLDRLVPPGASWEVVSLEGLTASIRALAAAGTPLVPTLEATALRLEDQSRNGAAELFALLDPSYETWWLEELAHRARTLDEETLAKGAQVVAKQRALLARLEAEGVVLVPGSGAPHPWLFPGLGLHRELAGWVASGVAPELALERATRGAAEALGIAADHGTIEPGKLADLVVCDGDPRAGLEPLARPELVCVRGRVLGRAELDDLLDAVAARERAKREALEVSLDFPGPALEGALLLEGVVETRSLGTRVAAERFAAARAADGALVLAGHVRYAGGEEVDVRQTLRDGALAELRVRARVEGRTLEVEGLWTAQRFRLRRSADGATVETRSLAEHPAFADLASVTAALAMGQIGAADGVAVLTFHEALEGEPVRWNLMVEEDGDYVVHTHTSAMAFRFDEHGAPLLLRTKVGQGVVETRLVETDAHGGGGLRPRGPAGGAARPREAGAESGG